MKDKSWHFYLPAMILLLILWYVISIIVHLPIIPSPVLVMERLGNIFTQTIAIHALYSLWRIIARSIFSYNNWCTNSSDDGIL